MNRIEVTDVVTRLPAASRRGTITCAVNAHWRRWWAAMIWVFASVLEAGVPSAARPSLTEPIIVSYYWPVEKGQKDLRVARMHTPNVINILQSDVHGTKEVRAYWMERGKLILNVIYPFRKKRSERELLAYFSENMEGGAGVAIDELLAHKWTTERRRSLDRTLRAVRKSFPDKLIFVWDASRWSKDSASLLHTVRDTCDVIMAEVYIPQDRGSDDAAFAPFAERIATMEAFAPGIRENTIIAIGAYPKVRNGPAGKFIDHVVAQVRFLRQEPTLAGSKGMAIYAPMYLTPLEQDELDGAIAEAFDMPAAELNP